MPRLVHCLGLFSLCAVATLYYAGLDVVKTLSPQGCRMSWMSPSYVLQSKFDQSWSPLARRYSLWLYREVGWESNEVCLLDTLTMPISDWTPAARLSRPLHSWECWLFSSSPLYSVVRDPSVLFVALPSSRRVSFAH